MEHLVVQYGYFFIFVTVLLEGETPVVIGGFLAHQGYLSGMGVALTAFVATFLGDQFYFHLVRHKGYGLLRRFPSVYRHIPRATRFIHRNETMTILMMRFLYGFRIAIPALLGLSPVRWQRYLILNFISAVVWASVYTSLGYFLGESAQLMLGNIQRFEKYVFGAIVAVIVLVAIYRWLRLR